MRYGGVVLPWKSKTDITKNSFWDDPCRLIPYYRGKSLFVLTNPGFMFLWIQFKSRWYSIDILVYIDNFSNQPFGVTSIFWPYGKHFSGQTDKGNRLQWRRSGFGEFLCRLATVPPCIFLWSFPRRIRTYNQVEWQKTSMFVYISFAVNFHHPNCAIKRWD